MSITTETIALILEQAKLKNMRVWDYVLQICVLLSSPLISQVQVELQAYMSRCLDGSVLMDSPLDHGLAGDPALYSKVKDALVSEVKVNMRLRQLVQTCQVEIEGRQARGQSVPHCQTSWIYQDFPVLLELSPVPTQPLTVLCDHVLDRYNLDKDEEFKRTTLRLEVASLWHSNSRQSQSRNRVLSWLDATTESVSEPQPARNSLTTGVTADPVTVSTAQPARDNLTPAVTADPVTVSTAQPVKGFCPEYTKIVSSDKAEDLKLRLVRRPGCVDADLSSTVAIASMLRESVLGESRLDGAGYLVYRQEKLARRRRKTPAQEVQTCTGDARPAAPVPVSVRVQETASSDVPKVDPKEASRRAFLENVARFQNRLRASQAQATVASGKGRKRKASDSSVCQEIQTKHSKSRMETTLTALKRHVTKRHKLTSRR